MNMRATVLCVRGNRVGPLPTARDIADNPTHIQIKELDAGIAGRAIGDLDAAVVNTDCAIKAGIEIPQERIAQEKVPGNPYRNFIAANAKVAKGLGEGAGEQLSAD